MRKFKVELDIDQFSLVVIALSNLADQRRQSGGDVGKNTMDTVCKAVSERVEDDRTVE